MPISTLDNFSIKKKAPNVERDLFDTIVDMVAWSGNYLPDVFECNVKADGKRYRYNVSNEVDPEHPELGKWREVKEGGSEVDLSNYYNKTETENLLEDYVKKEEGKGLSSNDYTNDEKKRITDLEDAVGLLNDPDDTKVGSIAEAVKNTLESAKQYTKDEIDKANKKGAITCDEKPTISVDGVVTYKKGGETLTTTNTNQWFYFSVGESLYQTTFIEGEEKTIKSDVEVDFSEYVSKNTDVVDTFTVTEAETNKIPNLSALKALKALEDEEIKKRVTIEQGADNANKILGTNEEGKVVLLNKEALGQTADTVSYENETHKTWNTVRKAIDGIIAKIEYVKPEIKTFTVTPATTVYEVGESVSNLVFNWSYNKDVTSQSLTDVELIDETDRTGTYKGTLSTTKTFSLNCSDGENTAKKDITIAFRNKVYYGSASEPADYDSAFILGLSKKQFATSKAGSYAVTVGAGEYGYIAFPSSFGTLSSVFIGGFETTVESCGSISFTNASGGVVPYSIYRTGRSGLGSITMEVK